MRSFAAASLCTLSLLLAGCFSDKTMLKLNADGSGTIVITTHMKAQAKKSTPVTFKFDKLPNGNNLLTIFNPGCDLKPDQNPPAGLPNTELPDEQLAMMKEMMGGLLVSIQLEVPGLVKTSSKWVEGSKITILEMDFDKFLSDPAKLKKLVAAQPKSNEEAKLLVKDFPGVKMTFEPETTIEFTGK